MSPTRPFSVVLVTRCLFTGTVDAASPEEAIDEVYSIWRTECPHPFDKLDDAELLDVTAEEAPGAPVPSPATLTEKEPS